jgi:hypothetical protein
MMVEEAVSRRQLPEGCEAHRSEVHTLCEAASTSQEAHERTQRLTREARREIVAARHRHEQAQMAADPQRRSDEKDSARESYLAGIADAGDEAARSEATAAWGRAVDRANRSATLAKRTLAKTAAELTKAQDEARASERGEHEARMRAETAEATCLAARVRLAACEEAALVAMAEATVAAATAATSPVTMEHVPAGAPTNPDAGPWATGSVARPPVDVQQGSTKRAAMRAVTYGQPLVIEGLIGGDRPLLELVAQRVADLTGLVSGQAVVQLQELVDAIISAASQDGFLIFDEHHRFWAHLSSAEAADVVSALGRLGFMLEPSEGWHAGRVPTALDLSMALAYAGLDARAIRGLPDKSELAELPRSIDVDAQAFLASRAPDLSLDHVVTSLGHRAETLGPLWNEWGQIRPILLSEQRELTAAVNA